MGIQVQRQVHSPDIGSRRGPLEQRRGPVSSHASFSGSVPESYDRYLGPALFEPYALDLVARLPSGGTRVLELACGTGRVTRHLRAALPGSATLVATDLNEPMLVHARAAVPDGGITWRQADAQALPFEDASFDVVVCQFGLMFLPDKVQGLREVRRVLAPGGVFIATVWESIAEHPHARSIEAVLIELFPDDPPRFLDSPHGYHDGERIRADYEAAGWETLSIESLRFTGRSASAREIAVGFASGSPLTHELAERGADPADVAERITGALGGDTPYELELAALVITATRR